MTTQTPISVRSQRLDALPPYLFAEIDRKRGEKEQAGADVINLGVGDPDRPTPNFIIEAMREAVRDPETHHYPYGRGLPEFRRAAADFLRRRFDVEADPDRHIIALMGSKDGISHLPLAICNPEDVVLTPDPCYPVYVSGAIFAHADVHRMPLTQENGWIPDLERIDGGARMCAKLLWSNYPNNPTSACADVGFFERMINFCAESQIVACSDHAYSEIYFDDRPPSLWQAPGADLDATPAIEFHSLSKTFNMTGWRIGFAVGHPDVITALADVKSNHDSGTFAAVQRAGAEALNNYDHEDVAAMRDLYRERRDAIVPGLREIGCEIDPPRAGFFCWGKCPPGWSSSDFANRCLDEADVLLIPGAGLSQHAEDYFRIALTVEVDRLREAGERLARPQW